MNMEEKQIANNSYHEMINSIDELERFEKKTLSQIAKVIKPHLNTAVCEGVKLGKSYLPSPKKVMVKMWKEVRKVKCVSGGDNFTKDKIYDVYGVFAQRYEDGGSCLVYVVKNDLNKLTMGYLLWFEVVE